MPTTTDTLYINLQSTKYTHRNEVPHWVPHWVPPIELVSVSLHTLGLLTCFLIMTDTMMDTAPRILQNGVNYVPTIAQTWQRFANLLLQCRHTAYMRLGVLFCVKPQCVRCMHMPTTIAEQHTTIIFIHRHILFQYSIANSVTGYNYTGAWPLQI